MSSPAKAVEAAKRVRVKLLVRVLFWTLSCNDESARDVSRNARFSRIWAFIEHWSASGSALRGESYKRPEAFFLIEIGGLGPRCVLVVTSGATHWNVDCGHAGSKCPLPYRKGASSNSEYSD